MSAMVKGRWGVYTWTEDAIDEFEVEAVGEESRRGRYMTVMEECPSKQRQQVYKFSLQAFLGSCTAYPRYSPIQGMLDGRIVEYLTSFLCHCQGRGVANIIPWSPLPLKPAVTTPRGSEHCRDGRYSTWAGTHIVWLNDAPSCRHSTSVRTCAANEQGVGRIIPCGLCGGLDCRRDAFSMTQFPGGADKGLLGVRL